MKIKFKKEEGFSIHGETYNSFREISITTPICGGVRVYEKINSDSVRLEFSIAGRAVSHCDLKEIPEMDGYKKTLNETIRDVEVMTDKNGAISKYICSNINGKTTHVFDVKSGVPVVLRRSDGYCTDIFKYDFRKGLINYNRVGSDNNRGIMVTKGNVLYDHLQKVLEYISFSSYFYGKCKTLEYFRTWGYNSVNDKYTFEILTDGFTLSLFNSEYKHVDTDNNYIDVYFDNTINKIVCLVYLGNDFRPYEMDYAEGQTWKYIFDDIDNFNIEIYNKENEKIESRKISNMTEVERYILIKNTVGDVWLPAGYNVLGSYVIIDKEGDYCIKSKYDTHCSKTHYTENKTCKNALQLAIRTYNKEREDGVDIIASIIEEWLAYEIYEVNYRKYGNRAVDTGYVYAITRRAMNRITGIKDEWDMNDIHSKVMKAVNNELDKLMNMGYALEVVIPYLAPEDYSLLKSSKVEISYSISHVAIIDGEMSECNCHSKYLNQPSGVSIMLSLCYEIDGLMVLRSYEFKVIICEKKAFDSMMTSSDIMTITPIDNKTIIGESNDGSYIMLMDKTCDYVGIKVIKEKEYDIDKSKYNFCIDGVDYNVNLYLDDVSIMQSLYDTIRGGVIYAHFR